MRFQRILQIPLFVLFLLLLWLAAFPLATWLEVDFFLRLDPLISIGSMITARSLISRVAWALLIMGAALILGRFFCGYLCPMGATIDFTDWLFRRKRKGRRGNSFEKAGQWRGVKYLLLVFVLASCMVGISTVFLFSPLSLITRFYSFVLYPVLLMLTNLFLDTLRPVFPHLGLDGLAFVHFTVPRFNTNLFVAALILSIVLFGLLQPRFWCRKLCPAGAILALFGRRPLIQRAVSEDCTECGRCVSSCPMAAIGEDYIKTAHSECIVCLKCQEVCPEGAVSFGIGKKHIAPAPEIDMDRRKILGAGVTGIAAAAVTLTSLDHLHGGTNPRPLRDTRLIRPPGALPEPQFQARCVRCGECMKGCLTNTLQPVWFEAGISGMWSPRITARLAGCEQNCNVCGHLCPTGAIRPLELEEKISAKVGTARIIKSRCIAWEKGQKCLICDEICPYNAISSQFAPGHTITLPVVDENKCNGCGYCETKCPVMGESAILVEPTGELRLASGSYREKARELGLVFHAKAGVEDHFILDGPSQVKERSPSDSKDPQEGGLPPGFIPEGISKNSP